MQHVQYLCMQSTSGQCCSRLQSPFFSKLNLWDLREQNATHSLVVVGSACVLGHWLQWTCMEGGLQWRRVWVRITSVEVRLASEWLWKVGFYGSKMVVTFPQVASLLSTVWMGMAMDSAASFTETDGKRETCSQGHYCRVLDRGGWWYHYFWLLYLRAHSFTLDVINRKVRDTKNPQIQSVCTSLSAQIVKL